MTTPETSIDDLKTKVTAIKTKMSSAKAENADTIKAEVKAAQDLIDAKTAELEKDKDKYKTELAQLKELSTTLAGFDTELIKLKETVTTTPSTETVDNTTDLDGITTGLEEMKTMIKETQALIDEYKSNKSVLTDEEKETKEKEIKEKKEAIEKKRKEIQALIDKVKKARIAVKLDAITDEKVKEALKKQKEIEKKKLELYQKELDDMNTPSMNAAEKTRNRVKKNPRATAGIVAGGALVLGWIGSRFRKRKTREYESQDEEKPGILKRARNIVKRPLGLGTGYYLIHGLISGKRSLSDMFDWEKAGPDNHDTDADKVAGYKKYTEENPESAEKYETFGSGVDDLYENIFDQELAGGWEDDANMAQISEDFGEEKMDGLVPYCMDNSFSNVDSVLSERGIEMDIYEQDIATIKAKVLGWIKGTMGGALKIFLKSLPSWLQFGKGDTDEDKFNSWFENDSATRVMELKAFFRQQMRVTVFLKTKEGELIHAIAEEKFKTDKGTFENPEEAIKDDDRFEKNIEKDPDYKSFRSGKILNAYTLLEKYKLMTGDLDEDTKKIVEECNDKREDIMDGTAGNDIMSKCETDIADGKLDAANQTTLATSCDKITEDIVDLEGVAQEKATDMYKRFMNAEDAVQQELLNNSTILPLLQKIRTEMTTVKEKIQAGTITAEDVKSFKQFMNNYFAMKKELEIGTNIYEMIKGDDKNRAIRFTRLFTDSFKNVIEGAKRLIGGDRSGLERLATGAAPICIIGADMVRFKMNPKAALKFHLLGPFALPGKLYQATLWTAKELPNGKYIGPSGSLRRMFFDGKDGPEHLVNQLKKGNISLKKAEKIVDGSQNRWIRTEIQTRRGTLYGGTTKNGTKIQLIQEAFFHNASPDMDQLKLLADYFDNKTFNRIVYSDVNECMRILSAYDAKKKSLTPKQIEFFELLTDEIKVPKSEVENLINTKLEKIDLTDVSTEDLKSFVKEIKKDPKSFSTADEINAYVKKTYKKPAGSAAPTTGAGNAADAGTDAAADAGKIDADLVKSQDEIYESVTEEIDDLNDSIKKQAIDPESITGKYYKKQVEGLEEFRGKVKSFKADEILSFNKLKELKFKSTHISELFSLGKVNTQVEAVLKQGDNIDNLIDVLKTQEAAIKLSTGGRGVSKELLQGLENIKAAKVAGKYSAEMADTIKSLFKFVNKIIG